MTNTTVRILTDAEVEAVSGGDIVKKFAAAVQDAAATVHDKVIDAAEAVLAPIALIKLYSR